MSGHGLGGWPVNLHFSETQGAVFHEPIDTCSVFECKQGQWFPESRVAAIEAVIEAARGFQVSSTQRRQLAILMAALDHLDSQEDA